MLLILILASCSTVKKNQITMEAKETDKNKVILNFKDGHQTVIYKTKKNYNNLVPVILSDDKSQIVSYPHPKDVFYMGELSYPIELKDGYLLDNRGINSNVAFLSITYEEYSKLETVPLLDELYKMILEIDPLTEIYNCGNRYTFKNEISDLNRVIVNNGLKECKCLTKE
jgi:hypothetical protein